MRDTNCQQAGKKAGAKNKTTECNQDDSSMESSDSCSSDVWVHNMEMDQIGTIGIKNLNTKIKKEPEDWVHIEDEMTCWEDI